MFSRKYATTAAPSLPRWTPRIWGNRLTVTSETILLELKGEKKSFDRFEIASKAVTGSVMVRKLIGASEQ